MNPDKTKQTLVSRITSLLGLNEKEFEKRKAYLQIDAQDIAVLQQIEPHLQKVHARIMDEFYHHLLQFDETAGYLQDTDIVGQLKDKQARYFEDLTNGRYDWSYVQNRLAVGVVHQQIGLQPRWFIGAYAKFINSLIPEICHIVGSDINKASEIIRALLKIVFLDINIVLDTYMTSDQMSIRAFKDYSENLFNNIPLGLVAVSKKMKILSCNEYMERFFAAEKSGLAGRNLYDVFPNSGLYDRAIEVINTKRPQTGIKVELEFNHRIIPCQISLTALDIAEPYQDTDSPGVLLIIEDVSEHTLLIQSTTESDDRVRAIMDNVADGIITIDKKGIIESYNKQAENMFGFHAADVIGRNVTALMSEPDASQHDGYLARYLSSGRKSCLGKGFRQVIGKHKDGSTFEMDLSISRLDIGSKTLFIGIVRDISDRVEAEKKMSQLSSALEQAADSVIITDCKGIIEYVNAGFESTTGFQRDDVIGKTPSIVKSGLQDQDFYKKLWQTIQRGEVFRDIIINRKKDGTLYYEEKTITPLRDTQNNISHFISTGKDITERMHTQKRMQFMAHHDALTLLPNRLLFLDRLSGALTGAKRNQTLVALLFLDLDRFKNINDSLGHALGDRLLQQVAKRLASCLREGDTVARLSGDEFALLLGDIKDQDDITVILHKVIEVLDEAFHIDGHELFISASLGITVGPIDGADATTLLKNADIAMYRAKSTGKSFSYFTPDMHTRAEERLLLENDLHRALHRNELFLVYQPQIDLKDDRHIIGIEALLRWKHPSSGIMLPSLFIPLMEETGIIGQVGEWVLDTACQQMRTWLDARLGVPHISINVSPRQLSDPEFTHLLLSALQKYNLEPAHLELEITESSLLENEDNANLVLAEIHKIGIKIAMDDFGTGYSSLSYLRKLPVSTLKIDQSFVNDVPMDKDDAELTNTIIAMGNSLNLIVIAEGVENQAQFDFLKQRGCHAVQGYLTGKPVTAEEILPVLSAQQTSSH